MVRQKGCELELLLKQWNQIPWKKNYTNFYVPMVLVKQIAG